MLVSVLRRIEPRQGRDVAFDLMFACPAAALDGRRFRLSITSACLCALYELADTGGNHSSGRGSPSDRRPPLVLEPFFIFPARGIAACRTRFVLVGPSQAGDRETRRELYGTRSERTARLLDQMELQLEDLEAAATEDELAAENAASRTQTVKSFERKRPARKPFPDHLPRERVVMAAPESCPCCGSAKLSKLGEDITETLEVIPPAVEGDPDGA